MRWALPLPPGLPEALLEPVRDPAGDLALRFARYARPVHAARCSRRATASASRSREALLTRLARSGPSHRRRIPSRRHRSRMGATPTCCAACAAARSRGCGRRSSRSRPTRSAASCSSWHGIGSARRGPMRCSTRSSSCRARRSPASVLEREILPARVADYQPAMLDTLMAAGEVVWVGVEPLGDRDGRIALYLTDHLMRLRAGPKRPPTVTGRSTDAQPRTIRRLPARLTARRSSRRFTRRRRRLSAGDRRRALGAGLARRWSPTTRCTRCAR